MMRSRRLRSGAAAVALAGSGVLVTAWAGGVVTLGIGPLPAAAADQCLPPPQVLLSEVARVAGTGSKLWADIRAVEQADAAAGTSGPGQVLQDMLNAATNDGYQWDCGSSQLTAPANAPPRIDLPPETTTAAPQPGPGAGVAGGGTTGAAGGGAAPGSGGGGGATVPGGGATGPGGTTGPGAQGSTESTVAPDPGSSILAAPAAGRSTGGGGLSNLVLIALAIGSGLLIVLVVRRQMARR